MENRIAPGAAAPPRIRLVNRLLSDLSTVVRFATSLVDSLARSTVSHA